MDLRLTRKQQKEAVGKGKIYREKTENVNCGKGMLRAVKI